MGAVALGNKHTCGHCRCRFYDMGRAAPSCPRCGGAPKARKLKTGGGKKRKKKVAETFDEPVRGTAESFDEFYEDAEFLGEDIEDEEESAGDGDPAAPD